MPFKMPFKRILVIIAVAVSAAMAVILVLSSPALAAIGTIQKGDAVWFLTDTRTTSNFLPTGGSCGPAVVGTAASLEDATLLRPGDDQVDAFDGPSATFWVDDTQVGGALSVISPTQVVFDEFGIGSLNAQLRYDALDADTLRVYLTLTNTIGADISVPVDYAGNYGSNGFTVVAGTGSGDLVFDTSDRWIVVDDTNIFPGPSVTTVSYGPDSPEATPSSVSDTVFECSGTEGALVNFGTVTIPAGQTRAFMIFQQLSTNSASALARTGVYSPTPPITSPLVSGLTQADLDRLMNWDYGTANIPPTITEIVGPVAPVAIDEQPVEVTVTFADPNASDTLTVSWDWGDGEIDMQSGAASPATQDHTYDEAGVYSVAVTVDDGKGGVTSDTFEFVVIYDGNGGFVSGGGWIMSEAGDCQLNAGCDTAEGMANFGFVSKYKKGSSVPTGNTQFRFNAGGFRFQADSYEWMVISGARAQYKGEGTIDGYLGMYKFRLTGFDASVNENDSHDVDRFRIRIYTENPDGTEIVAYDNGTGDDMDETGDSGTDEIGGGNISVKKARGKNN